MSVFKKKNKGPFPVSKSTSTEGYTITSGGSYYISPNSTGTYPIANISGAISFDNINIGNQDTKTYLEGETYIKVKIKTGEEVDIKLTDYIKYPFRMGKELEDSTKEEFDEWKMVNEL